MKPKLVIYGVMLGGIAGATGQYINPDSRPDEVVTTSYWSSDAGEIKLIGVCDALKPEIACWNADRHPDPLLAKQVAERFRPDKSRHPSEPAQIPFFFRKKNRIVVFQTPIYDSKTRFQTRLNGFWTPDQQYMQDVAPPQFPYVEPYLQCFALSVGKEKTTASVNARLLKTEYSTMLIPPKTGTEVSNGKITVSIGSITRVTRNTTMGYPYNGPAWNILIKISGDSAQSHLQPSAVIVDEKGNGYRGFDKDGRPIKWNFSPKMTESGHSAVFSMGASSAMPIMPDGHIGEYQPKLGGRICTVSVDPKYIPNLSISFTYPFIVQFKDIPLDPK